MYSAQDNTALPVLGFPIRRSAGQCLFSDSPRLIAAVHVLPRLLVPRHPPCALTILTVSSARARRRGRCIRRRTRRYARRKYPLLAFVQFSSFVEAGRTEVFRPRSLKTEQRSEATSRHEAESPPSGTSGRHSGMSP